jgi:chromosome segregation ATPase
MSQTETILLIVLGFSLASLIALFMGRMVWTVALKLGARRMQRQMPSTLVDLQAERNRLRAEYAMMSQRLGSRLEEAKLKAAEQMAEVNRYRNRLRQMETGEIAGGAELRELKSRVKVLEAALAEAAQREDDLLSRLGGAEQASPKPRRRKATAAEAHATPPPSPPHADPEIRLRQRIEKLAELARTGGSAPPPPEPQRRADASPDPDIAEKLAEAERRTAELEEQLRRLDAEWDAKSATDTASEGKAAPASDDDNVISLSARIHNLRKSLGTQP